MSKTKAEKVNLSTRVDGVLATMHEEMPKAWYFFRKKYQSKEKYKRAENAMLNKALEEKCDQFTDIDYWISPVGNRWMTYTHVQYFPKAHYAIAYHFSFIYYETYASCGAFFPMYSTKQMKKKNGKPDGVIRYTDHFFYQLSERSGIEYRSKELIRKFVSERCENAMSADDNGKVIQKFKGGHGFGKELSKHPRFIDCRTYLDDEQLNSSQRKKCEPVDAMYEIIRDGMLIKDVALHTVFHEDLTAEQAAEDGMKRWEALKKLGMEKPMGVLVCLHLTYIHLLQTILHVEVDMKQSAVISHIVAEHGMEMMNKWSECDPKELTLDNLPFRTDLTDVMVKVAKQMKLKSLSRERIEEEIEILRKSKKEL